MKSWLETYATSVLNGEINACRKIKKIYAYLLDKVQHPEKYKPWVFDINRANAPIEFIETFCKCPTGQMGRPLTLELFQKAKHQAVFGFVHEETGERQYQEVLDIRGRKNGKTTESSADGLYMLVADGEGSPEVYFIATAKDQASKGFVTAHKMVQMDQNLADLVRKRQADLYCPFNFGTMKSLASNTNSLDGLDGYFISVDELSAIKNRDVYDLMKQSGSARWQPLLSSITTNGFVRHGVFDTQYAYATKVLDNPQIDERFLPIIYELDDRREWEDESCWIKANPGLGTIKKFSTLQGYVKKAQHDPAFLPTVLVKDFNLIENAATFWLDWDTAYNPGEFDFRDMGFRYGIGGFDAADTTDLSAARIICMRPDDDKIYTKSMYWIPETVAEKLTADGNRRERDNAPYDLWIKQGLMRVYPGNKVNKDVFLDWFREVQQEDGVYLFMIGYDPWHIDDSLLARFEGEFGKMAMVPVRQGAPTLSQPMYDLKADMQANRIIYNKNPIDTMCFMNTCIKTDCNANIQPVKTTDSRKRIDGMMSLLCAYVILCNNYDDYQALL